MLDMDLSKYSFHDSMILEAREIGGAQTLEFMIDFFDWDNDFYIKKVLRFTGVASYQVEEIPFAGVQTILGMTNLGSVFKDFGQISLNKNMMSIKMETNAGYRLIVFDNWELINSH